MKRHYCYHARSWRHGRRATLASRNARLEASSPRIDISRQHRDNLVAKRYEDAAAKNVTAL